MFLHQLQVALKASLEIRVDNVLWKEVDDLYNLKSDDRAYIIRIEDNSQTRVIFGDGIKGAIPSAGLENIEAKYKVGLGLTGMLKENQLSVIASRPLGVRSVTNPMEPTGAADPEDRDHARQNAPLTVLTMERIVSLEDFENFAQAFAGIEKAQAVWLWNGKERIVHVTIASANGLQVKPTSSLYNNLIKAINISKDPVIPFKVDSFHQKFFNLEAKILVAADMQPESVLLAVKSALLDKFSFESRQLGQSVTLIETIATIQQVKGVSAVDVYYLYSGEDNDKELKELIPSNMACAYDNGNILPAELLTINPDGVTLREMAAP